MACGMDTPLKLVVHQELFYGKGLKWPVELIHQ